MEMGKMYITIFIIFSLFSVSMFFININQANDFKQYVNYQIERNGGLTPTAMGKINKYNDEHYNGRFTVSSATGSRQMQFGDEIDYTITGEYKFLFISLPAESIKIKGSAISMIR